MAKKKDFILDTNVLIDDPDVIFKMDDNNIIIPDVVLDEMDHFKNEDSERGQNVRTVTRQLDLLGCKGNLGEGVFLGEGKGTLRVMFSLGTGNKEWYKEGLETKWDTELKRFPLSLSLNDNRIVWLAKWTGGIIITKDANLRVRANAVGVPAENYKNDQIYENPDAKKYTGRTTAYLPPELISRFRQHGYLEVSELLNGYDKEGKIFDEELFVNEFLEMHPISGKAETSVIPARFDGRKIVPLYYVDAPMSGVHPRNIGQMFMKECMMQPASTAPLVIIKGMAGTAKTFFSLAAGLERYANGSDKEYYNRILVCRPYVMMDKDPGALPGTEEEKIAPLMRPIRDNLFSLQNDGGEDRELSPHEFHQKEAYVEGLFEDGIVKAEALAYLRGRTLNHYWFILDEMQNSTPTQAKAVVTRSGRNSKFILLGDPDQIDNPRNTKQSNGLVYASEKMKGSPLCWQVQLTKDECGRSDLAEEAAIRMKGSR